MIFGQKKTGLSKSGCNEKNDSHPRLRSASSQFIGRSPGSWFWSVPPAFPSRLIGAVTIFLEVDSTSYSGATAPVSHRLPFSVPISRNHLWTVIKLLNRASAELRSQQRT
ncbi:uncharacterized protein METZ01_LOCUS388963 [marine metagenome]|uniref:Uncharacterized protein n=1 Tax=marine metagenome TaxID=408172 RepID=A0A382UPB8_9ZZZZ